jgi:preprotein translocase subunit SecE
LAERKRRGDDAVDGRLDEVTDDDIEIDDEFADDELDSDLDEDDVDDADEDDEPAPRRSRGRAAGTPTTNGAKAASLRKPSRLSKAAVVEADDEDDDGDDDAEDGKAAAKANGKRGPKGRTTKPGDKRPVKKGGERPNIFARFINFVREVVAELRKVIWPTRKELLTYTAVVVIFVTIMFTLVAGLDWIFTKGVVTIFGHGTTSK